MKNTLHCILIVFCVAACTSSPPMVSDEPRTAIDDWKSIVVVTEMPQGAEKVADLRASSRTVASAVAELKQQAAKAGANTVVLESTWSEREIASASRNGSYPSYSLEIVKGIAVHVDE